MSLKIVFSLFALLAPITTFSAPSNFDRDIRWGDRGYRNKPIIITEQSLEQFLTQTDWFIPDRDLVFQVFRHRSGSLAIRTCPVYRSETLASTDRADDASEKTPNRKVTCLSSSDGNEKIRFATLQFNSKTSSYSGVFSREYWLDTNVLLMINPDTRLLEIRIQNDTHRALSVRGLVQFK